MDGAMQRPEDCGRGSNDTPVTLRYRRHSPYASPPMRATSGAAGYDLCSAADVIVPAQGRALIPTDLSFEFPKGVYGRLAPRSGLAVKHFIDVGAGVIDGDYRGIVCVLLFNFSDSDYHVRCGDRVVQLILERHLIADLHEVDHLRPTERGDSGFGSTGGF
ncbi:dUTPase [Fowl aviadenovirus 5]|uniref:dUTP diphosphatase n=1 Tax=Fowl aviadenovirus 5 TaxID=172861 RepID=R4N0M9_9ADEN|nr:dUTPase [Fowl aviadenovirus 5]AGL34670.1 deoxyuridine triphosphatase [Fowl aviadenovirus 5]